MKKIFITILLLFAWLGIYIAFFDNEKYQDFHQENLAIYQDVNQNTVIAVTTNKMNCLLSEKQYIGKVDIYRKIKCETGIEGYVLLHELLL